MHWNKFGLSPERLCAASFDGASNMSDHRGGTVCIFKKFHDMDEQESPNGWTNPSSEWILSSSR